MLTAVPPVPQLNVKPETKHEPEIVIALVLVVVTVPAVLSDVGGSAASSPQMICVGLATVPAAAIVIAVAVL